MKSRPNQFFVGLLLLVLTLLHAGANGPPTETPSAPPFPASEAAKLGDEYIAKTFPQFPKLYCFEVSYDSDDNMKPDRSGCGGFATSFPIILTERFRAVLSPTPAFAPYSSIATSLLLTPKNRHSIPANDRNAS